MANLSGIDPSSYANNFNLGFYFDLKLKNPAWMVHTGVIVKSTMGAAKLDVYSLDNPELDNSFAGGSVKRRLGYFNVPILMKYKFSEKFFVEAGPACLMACTQSGTVVAMKVFSRDSPPMMR